MDKKEITTLPIALLFFIFLLSLSHRTKVSFFLRTFLLDTASSGPVFSCSLRAWQGRCPRMASMVEALAPHVHGFSAASARGSGGRAQAVVPQQVGACPLPPPSCALSPLAAADAQVVAPALPAMVARTHGPRTPTLWHQQFLCLLGPTCRTQLG